MSERSTSLRNPTRPEVLDHLRLIHSESAKRAKQLTTLYQEIHAWKQLSSELSAHNEALVERILKLEDEIDEEEDIEDDMEAEKEDLDADILDAKKELGLLIDDIRCMRNDLDGKNKVRVHEELQTIRKRAIETEKREAADLEDTLARVDAMTVDLIGGPAATTSTSGASPTKKTVGAIGQRGRDAGRTSTQSKSVVGARGAVSTSSYRDPIPRSSASSSSGRGIGKGGSRESQVPRARIDLSSSGSYSKRAA